MKNKKGISLIVFVLATAIAFIAGMFCEDNNQIIAKLKGIFKK